MDVETILKNLKEKYSEELDGYIYFDSATCSSVTNGSHIKIIDLYGNLYSSGFLVGIKNIDKPSRTCIITMSFNKKKCLKLPNYFFFYKKIKFTKREIFLNFLNNIKK